MKFPHYQVRPLRILLKGYYGYRNSGDDGLLNGVVYGLQKIFKTAKFTILSKEPVKIISGIKVNFVKSTKLWVAKEILKNDCLVYGGGGIFQDNVDSEIKALKRRLKLIRFAKFLRKKVFFVSISIGPLHTKEGMKLSKQILQQANFISVRDLASYCWLQENKITVLFLKIFDITILLKDFCNRGQSISCRGQTETLGISLMSLSVLGRIQKFDEIMLNSLANVVNELLEENQTLQIKIFVFHDGDESVYGDRNICEQFYRLLEKKNRVIFVDYDPDVIHLLEEITSCHAFVGMRLHAGIYAYITAVPFILVDYHPKCLGFAKEVDLPQMAIIQEKELINRWSIKDKITLILNQPERMSPLKPVEMIYIQTLEQLSQVGKK